MSASTDPITLVRYCTSVLPQSDQDLVLLLSSIQTACKSIANAVRRAGIDNLYGLAGVEQNVQGEDVKKLDILSNEYFVNACSYSGKVCAMVSEETAEMIPVDESRCGNYVICFDPLDGSTNIDAAVPVGSIFGIYRRVSNGKHGTKEDVLQPGKSLVAAGYAMYSAATLLVLSLGNGTVGFTLDSYIGEFVLTHPNIRIPSRGKIYSVNEGNGHNWNEPTRKLVHLCKNPTDPKHQPYSLRYIGSMVADLHRTLLYGGIFMYPADKKNAKGKLRLMYECNPMAFLVEQAGGKAITGRERILDILPDHVHQRVPIYVGSAEDVDNAFRMYNEEDAKPKN
eukprot:ANDGO_04805.mRNA.1 Fructose-1